MTELERIAWNAILDSEMNALYYRYIARRYKIRDKFLQIFVAVLATSAVGSLQLWKLQIAWFKWSWVWDILSLLAVIISVSAPFMNFSKISNKANTLRPIFQRFTSDYEDLWVQRNQLKENTFRKKLSSLKKLETDQTSHDSNMPRDKKLIEKCQDEIIKARGLK